MSALLQHYTGMIALYGTERLMVERAVALIAGSSRVVHAWHELESCVTSTRACVLVIPDLGRPVIRAHIARMCIRARFTPVILVTHFAASNARWLKEFIVHDIVWWQEIEATLPQAVASASSLSPVHRLAQWVSSHPRMDTVLKEALIALCAADPPLQRLDAEIARAVCISTSTLEAKWRRTFGCSEYRTLRRFVMWVRLLWAVEHLSAGLKEMVIAERLGVDMRTLTRTARTLTGMSLRAAEKRGSVALLNDIIAAHQNGAIDDVHDIAEFAHHAHENALDASAL